MLWILNLQLAKLAGNTVVATCGGNEKAILLKQLGVDRVIDYKAEDIKTVCMCDFMPHNELLIHQIGLPDIPAPSYLFPTNTVVLSKLCRIKPMHVDLLKNKKELNHME